MAKSPEEMLAAMIANLKATTGKSIDEWLVITRATKLAKHGEIVAHLKSTYGIGHGYANQIAQQTLRGGAPAASGDDLVDAQYAGAKAALRPIHDALVAALKKLGKDVELAPKKAYVSVRRNKQFAIVQPSTATRLDVGINLPGVKPTARLEASGSFNAMVSHRVRLESKAQVDAELIAWLKQAYEAS
jgi:predicted transport protein